MLGPHRRAWVNSSHSTWVAEPSQRDDDEHHRPTSGRRTARTETVAMLPIPRHAGSGVRTNGRTAAT